MSTNQNKSKYFEETEKTKSTKEQKSQNIGKYKQSTKPPAAKTKRTSSEMADSSMEEMSTILSDLDEIKSALKKSVTKSDLTDIVKSIVKEMFEENKKEMETRMKEIEDVYMRKCGDLQDKIDGLGLEMESLRELNAKKDTAIRNLNATLDDAMRIANEARSRSNYNEQYSRKNNIKIFGLKESNGENVSSEVCKMLKSAAKVELKEEEILAAHRLPSKLKNLLSSFNFMKELYLPVRTIH
ncbi:hypothetical protein FSP39_004210 [Pinctada imbricata]|uniref:Uncharacterized protein n=1 Tax=Pinctada imbricata TaxID=66713 RepID=A0AA88XTQ2_PINIB|nr:hypothetical protein FSP39_004210 [Pinctada imbricata]